MLLFFRLHPTTTYVVVSFLDHRIKDKAVTEMVPSSWVFVDKNTWWCLFPTAKDYPHLDEWVENETLPKQNWPKYKIQILGQASKTDFI